MERASLLLALAATGIAIAVPLYALRERGRTYALVATVILALSFPASFVICLDLASTFPRATGLITGLFAYGFIAGGVHLASLVRARLRPAWFRAGISIPGMTFIAAGSVALLWIAAFSPFRIVAWWIESSSWLEVIRAASLVPIGVALASLPTSLGLRRERVHIDLTSADALDHDVLTRVTKRSSAARPSRATPLRLVQITDPHLGPWQPIALLRRRIDELLSHDPDLVLLTGDFLTMEARGTPGSLARALEPLRDFGGRCFAVYGNHDHEAKEEVRRGLEENGVALLVDDEACAQSSAGRVQILGSDWVRREPAAHLGRLLARYPRRPDHLRLLLLHDPVGFAGIAAGEVDLTLSGHTHGGQLGLLSLGFDWTVLSSTRWPDHGLFAQRGNHLYVHRGTGFYGFPLRIGVPGEASVLEVAWSQGGPGRE